MNITFKIILLSIVSILSCNMSTLAQSGWSDDTVNLAPSNMPGVIYFETVNAISQLKLVAGNVCEIEVVVLAEYAEVYLWGWDDLFFFHRGPSELHQGQRPRLFPGDVIVVSIGRASYRIRAVSAALLGTKKDSSSDSMLNHMYTRFYDLNGVCRSIGSKPKSSGTYIMTSPEFSPAKVIIQ